MRDPEISIASKLGIGHLTARMEGVDLYFHQLVVAPKMISERMVSKCAKTLVVLCPDLYVASISNGTRLFTIFRSVRIRRLRQGRRLSCFSIPVMPACPLSQWQ